LYREREKKEERMKAEMYYASRGLFLQYTTQQLIVALVMNDKSMCNAN
jgi:hypothetical protein